MPTRSPSRGFTIAELLAVVGMIGVAGALTSAGLDDGVPPKTARATATAAITQPETDTEIQKIRKKLDAMREQIDLIEKDLLALHEARLRATPGALERARARARQLKDATQVRGITQSLIVWANQNQGRYPFPSKVDAAGATVKGPAEAKDTTANILSMLIFSGHIPAEMCVSAAEANPNVVADADYKFDRPSAAADPASALWDPAFSADFTAGKTGNVSFAHLQPFGERVKLWADTFNSTEAIVSNRGPEIASVTRDAGNPPAVKTRIDTSVTFRIHGEPGKWEGNVGYNDGHVMFETSLVGDPEKGWPRYLDKHDKWTADVLFFDEADSKQPTGNLYLGIFTTSGRTMQDWTAIWD